MGRLIKNVKVKSNRNCSQCSKLIERGSECGTYSEKYKGRSWVCLTCLSHAKFVHHFTRSVILDCRAGESDLDEVDIVPVEDWFIY